MSTIQALRSLTLNLVLFSSLLISHHLGGGDFSFSPDLIPLFFLSFVFFWVRPMRTIEGPKLAALLVIFQVFGHVGLNSAQRISAARMSSAHLIAILVSYIFAKNFDECIQALFSLLRSIFITPKFLLRQFIAITLASFQGVTRESFSSDYLSESSKRGPPLYAVILDVTKPA